MPISPGGLQVENFHEPQGRWPGQRPHAEFPGGRLKVGRLYGRKFETRRQAMNEVMNWMTLYNHNKIHSKLGQVSPGH